MSELQHRHLPRKRRRIQGGIDHEQSISHTAKDRDSKASESMVRRLSFFREGEVFDSKKYKTRICRPLMIWTDKDLWDYHKKFKIPRNSLYDLMDRNGCMPCTGFKNWKAVMNRANPKLYQVVSRQIGEPILNKWCK